MSTTWFLQEILSHQDSKITCVDTFQGSIEHDQNEYNWSAIKERFLKNIEISGQKNKVRIIQKPSQEALIELNASNEKFDIIFIDGSHLAKDVLSDSVLSWSLLKKGGIMVHDDYKWNQEKWQAHMTPHLAIDSFLSCYRDDLKLLHKGYRVILQKI